MYYFQLILCKILLRSKKEEAISWDIEEYYMINSADSSSFTKSTWEVLTQARDYMYHPLPSTLQGIMREGCRTYLMAVGAAVCAFFSDAALKAMGVMMLDIQEDFSSKTWIIGSIASLIIIIIIIIN